ncbi:uncharacterized protein LOC113515688 [Galleria mellonella]|uniref:Uncharacterized protein LOC113515688 n=1 Tax=Galleria mellonella TaxID=7137 RepID=A0ABM3MSL7_GALME|nr:uncharacterized protein LOC113515688 [Galleria mellonella]
MHSCETLPAAPATGPNLLLELGRLIIRARSTSPVCRAPAATRDRLLQAKLLAAKPSTSQQVQSQPKPECDEARPAVEAALNDHVQALWNDQIPICIEVLLAPDCADCYSALSRADANFDKHTQRALLLERWTISALLHKNHEIPGFITSQWLLNAIRSQLHFSQLSAWLATLKSKGDEASSPTERRRKLSRETCNIKKLESNCDEPTEQDRKLHIVYSIKIPGENHMSEFTRPPTDHNFPITDIGESMYLKVVLQSLPRVDEIPVVKCNCRRNGKDPTNIQEELVGILNDLTLGPRSTKFASDFNEPDKGKKILDDRMHTPCSENGKHKCNCDDESDSNHRSSTRLSQEPKKLDERRLKEIAKYKRRLRKENKMKKLCDSTSSEGDNLKPKETHTSIPILQAARFDRFRAIGCYRNQTYLTLPASRIESKSPFVETVSIPPAEFKKTNTVSTQTDDLTCQCGSPLLMKCDGCSDRGMVRSEANYNLALLDQSEVLLDAINKCQEQNGARRKCEDDDKALKKHKCDNSSSNIMCDKYNNSLDVESESIIKRPKLRRFYPVVDRIEKIVAERSSKEAEKDMEELHLRNDDTVFSLKPETKRQKTFSISEDYVLYEKCDYGTIDKCDMESPSEENGFQFPDPKKGQDTVPSPTEMDRFRWRFDSAASMVFHTKTGLPLTSSPAPLRRGNNCFDFDDSINGISGIKSALFHPISPLSPAPPTSPSSPRPISPLPVPTSSYIPAPKPVSTPAPVPTPVSVPAQITAPGTPPPKTKKGQTPKLKIGPSGGLLGSFEECALQGRLEPVATVAGFSAELGASGAFCPPHRRLPVTVFFYAPGGTNAPYMGHINLGPSGYRVARSGTIQVSLFNPHGTLVKMFVVLYELTSMPPLARTFLRQRTLYMPAGADPAAVLHPHNLHRWLRYLIHLRFMTSKSGKLYLHTDIRILVSRKADLDTATAHSTIFRPIPTNQNKGDEKSSSDALKSTNQSAALNNSTNKNGTDLKPASSDARTTNHTPNRVFGGCGDFERSEMKEIGYENQNGVSYELRSFTYAPDNPRYSPR